MVFLGEALTLPQTLALGAIILASMGSTLTMRREKKIQKVDIS
jgi:inner membrane transporter RhtA